MSERQAGESAAPRRGRDWDALAAVIAALIGLLALALSGYTAWLQRQQVRAQVWPYLETGIAPRQRQVTLTNKGVGPARVRGLQVYVNGKPQRGWPAVFDALGLPQLRDTPASTVNGVVISAGGIIQQLNFASDEDFRAFYRQYPRLALKVCYCSALDECWVLDERERQNPDRHLHPTSACQNAGADEFVDNVIARLGKLPQARPPKEEKP